jgi:hypothetical protein
MLQCNKNMAPERQVQLMETAMTKILLSFVAAAAVAAPALADTPLAFQRDGMDVIGTVRQDGDIRVLQGVDRASGKAFNLRVKGGYVTGIVDGTRVAYPAPKTRSVEVAAR